MKSNWSKNVVIPINDKNWANILVGVTQLKQKDVWSWCTTHINDYS